MTDPSAPGPVAAFRRLSRTDQVTVGCWFLVLVQVAVTGWSLAGSWFYSDDFIFLEDAWDRGLSLDLLLTPHDSQLMPIGVAISWVVAHAGTFAWGVAATITTLLDGLAAATCALMLRTLFGARPLVLVPLAFYVLAPMALEAVQWWAAALNAVTMHVAFFLLVTALARWTRTGRPVWVVAAAGAFALAALSGPRGLVMAVPVALVTLLYLLPRTGLPWRRQAVRALVLAVPTGLVGAGYLVLYGATTPSPVEAKGDAPALALLRNLVLESWLPSLVGGPLRWYENNPPMSQPDSPVWLTVVAGLVVLALLAAAVRADRWVTAVAVLVLAAQLAITWLALVFGRGLQLGESAALMTRYLTDTLPVTTLVLAMLLVAVVDAPRPLVLPRWGVPALAGAGALMVVASLVSTVQYAAGWHADYPARAFVQNARATLQADPAVIADVIVPHDVQSRLSYPNNLPSRLLEPLGDDLRAVERGTNLHVLDVDGRHRPAVIQVSDESEPGPRKGCGYAVTDEPVTIRMDPDRTPFFWWATVGYLSGGDGEVSVSVDGRPAHTARVYSGLNTYFWSGEDPVSSVTLRALTPDLTVCVSRLELGDLVAAP